MSLNIGIALDNYKLKTFERILHENDYEYQVNPGLTDKMYMLVVFIEKEQLDDLALLVKEMNDEARKLRVH